MKTKTKELISALISALVLGVLLIGPAFVTELFVSKTLADADVTSPIIIEEKGDYVKKYEKISQNGESKYLISLSSGDNIIADTVERKENTIHYNIDGKELSLPFLVKSFEQVDHKIDILESMKNKEKTILFAILVVTVLLAIITYVAVKGIVKSETVYTGIFVGLMIVAIGLLFSGMFLMGGTNKLSQKIASESVSIYVQNNNGDIPAKTTDFEVDKSSNVYYNIDEKKMIEFYPELSKDIFDYLFINEDGKVFNENQISK